jgi:hypothetical protein
MRLAEECMALNNPVMADTELHGSSRAPLLGGSFDSRYMIFYAILQHEYNRTLQVLPGVPAVVDFRIRIIYLIRVKAGSSI